jgi:hypothetical protein
MAATVDTSSHKEACSLISFFCMKHFCPLEICCQLIEVCDDGTMRVQNATKLCREFDSGQTDFCQSVGHMHESSMSGRTDMGKTEESQIEVYYLHWRHQLHSNDEVEMAVNKVL